MTIDMNRFKLNQATASLSGQNVTINGLVGSWNNKILLLNGAFDGAFYEATISNTALNIFFGFTNATEPNWSSYVQPNSFMVYIGGDSNGRNLYYWNHNGNQGQIGTYVLNDKIAVKIVGNTFYILKNNNVIFQTATFDIANSSHMGFSINQGNMPITFTSNAWGVGQFVTPRACMTYIASKMGIPVSVVQGWFSNASNNTELDKYCTLGAAVEIIKRMLAIGFRVTTFAYTANPSSLTNFIDTNTFKQIYDKAMVGRAWGIVTITPTTTLKVTCGSPNYKTFTFLGGLQDTRLKIVLRGGGGGGNGGVSVASYGSLTYVTGYGGYGAIGEATSITVSGVSGLGTYSSSGGSNNSTRPTSGRITGGFLSTNMGGANGQKGNDSVEVIPFQLASSTLRGNTTGAKFIITIGRGGGGGAGLAVRRNSGDSTYIENSTSANGVTGGTGYTVQTDSNGTAQASNGGNAATGSNTANGAAGQAAPAADSGIGGNGGISSRPNWAGTAASGGAGGANGYALISGSKVAGTDSNMTVDSIYINTSNII